MKLFDRMLQKATNSYLADKVATRLSSAILGKATGTGTLIPSGGWEILFGAELVQSDGIWRSWTTAQREQVLRNMSVVYACVRYIVTSFVKAPPIAQKEVRVEGGMEAQTIEHPIIDVLDHPNAWQRETAVQTWASYSFSPVNELTPFPFWTNSMMGVLS